jgi:hypothetical protein
VAVAFEHAMPLSLVVSGGPVSNHLDACISSLADFGFPPFVCLPDAQS